MISQRILRWSALHSVRWMWAHQNGHPVQALALLTTSRFLIPTGWQKGDCCKYVRAYACNFLQYDMFVARGTNSLQPHSRNTIGFPHFPWRTCLLILLCTALQGAWTLEQPDGSVLEFLPAFRTMLQSIFACGGVHAVPCFIYSQNFGFDDSLNICIWGYE